MNYEKEYKDALDRAKKLYEQGTIIETLSYVFPELKESEDEKIRKELIKHLKEGAEGYEPAGGTSDYQRWLAWLEKQGEQKNKINSCKFTCEDILALECSMKIAKITKGGDELYKILVPLYNKIHNAYLDELQGEQKPVDKVEPKFKVGEWITHNTANFVFKIINVGSNGYEVVNRENYKKTISFDNEDNYHLWTIQDAKIDVLKHLLFFLDSLEVKKEPVSEDLEEAATKYARKQVANPDYPTYNDEYELECAFEAGAQWQKEQMIDKACEFLKSYRQDTPDGIGYIAGIVDDKTIEEFKQAMKE